MESKIYLPAVALVLALAITSGEALKCYECKAVGSANDDCSGEMLKNMGAKPIECSLETMRSWHNKVSVDPTLTRIARLFQVDPETEGYHHRDPQTPMACVKMSLRVDNQPVTLRTCQTAKTEEVDPCRTTREKISQSYKSSTTVSYCGMCETDECNGSYALSPSMIMLLVPLVGSMLMSLGSNSA